jgi:hypothetical protein
MYFCAARRIEDSRHKQIALLESGDIPAIEERLGCQGRGVAVTEEIRSELERFVLEAEHVHSNSNTDGE